MQDTPGSLDKTPVAAGSHGPFIHLFRTSKCWYVFDVNTNRILQIPPGLWLLLDHWSKHDQVTIGVLGLTSDRGADSLECTRILESLRKDLGVFSTKRPERLAAFDPADEHSDKYEHGMEQLILEVTQACNLRCKYCAYSGHYPLNRGHSLKAMSIDLAKKAIDFFLARCTATESPTIGFYGGEPLFECEVIRNCIEHASGRHPGLRFQITTNGTILGRGILEFFARHSVTLLVSLDGPAENHDRNRPTRGGGPSSQLILENLCRAKAAYPEYYAKHIGISTVIAPNVDPRQTWRYFEQHRDIIGNGAMTCRLVSEAGTSYFESNPVSAQWTDAIEEMRRSFYEALISGAYPLSKILESMFQAEFLKIYKRDVGCQLPSMLHLNGCCQPGTRRLFVDCDGRFHMCERINSTMPIGDIERGIDLGLVKRIVDEYRQISEAECCKCWLVRLCPMCFASCAQNGGFTREHKRGLCETTRLMFDRVLTDYCEIAERNPAAFMYLDDVVVT